MELKGVILQDNHKQAQEYRAIETQVSRKESKERFIHKNSYNIPNESRTGALLWRRKSIDGKEYIYL